MPQQTARHHVRTGCRTCKTRKVKCDETRPACKRCTTTRRPCAYDPDGPAQSLSLYRPNQLAARNQKEGRAFQFFTSMVSPVLGGPADAYFWTHLALQFSHFEPAVRHAILAISSLYEDFSRGARITRQVCGSSFAVGHYNLAVRRARVAGNDQLVLLLCVLFVCIEYLQGDIDAVFQHSRYGIMMLNHSSCSVWARDHLVPIFRRLSLLPMFFGGARHMRLPTLTGFDSPMPMGFVGIADAHASIDDLMSRVMCRAFDGDDVQRRELATMLDEWDSRVRRLEVETPLSATMDRYALCSMRIKRKIAGIHLDTPASHTELWFDQQLDAFRSIVDLAGEASQLWAAAGEQQLTPPSIFSFNMSFLPLMFFVVIKCRCLETRLRGLSLMARVGPAKEGLFDVGTMYRVCRRLIELEHGILLQGYEDGDGDNSDGLRAGRLATEGIPPEERRVFAVPVNHELDVISGLDGRMRYRRQVRFLARDHQGRVSAREEYIYDDEPRGCGLQIPPMRSARRA